MKPNLVNTLQSEMTPEEKSILAMAGVPMQKRPVHVPEPQAIPLTMSDVSKRKDKR
jgi:hypothetical protein